MCSFKRGFSKRGGSDIWEKFPNKSVLFLQAYLGSVHTLCNIRVKLSADDISTYLFGKLVCYMQSWNRVGVGLYLKDNPKIWRVCRVALGMSTKTGAQRRGDRGTRAACPDFHQIIRQPSVPLSRLRLSLHDEVETTNVK